MEAGRPDSVTREKLEAIKKHKVDRISVNPQTMKDETLKIIGRHHSVQQTIDAYKLAREVGFDNINMDLIIGLTGETAEDVRVTLSEIEKLSPDSLTVHTLAVKRAARLNIEMDRYRDQKSKEALEMMTACQEYTKSHGYEPYYLYRQKNMAENLENIGYAKPGKEGLYNVLIMEEKQTIVACGAGTISKRVYPDGRIERCDNVKDVAGYIERIEEMIERKKELYKDS